MEKNILQRHLKDLFSKERFAHDKSSDRLPIIIKKHNSLIRRRLGNVDMQLQENKAVNLSIAAPCVDGIIIRPGETFSFWRLVGRDTKRRGFKEGLAIARGCPTKRKGGGMCQFTNLIHWMVLHSDLTITEHHHHDGLDLFPDFNRQIPFGTGTSISYNYLDYRVRNDTNNTYQLRLWVDGEYLRGELRAVDSQPHTFHIHAENEYFSREGDVIYRNGQVFRDTIDATTGNVIESKLIRTNHARVMYECPPNIEIREN
jgi:vancomycin resistance protein VanW